MLRSSQAEQTMLPQPGSLLGSCSQEEIARAVDLLLSNPTAIPPTYLSRLLQELSSYLPEGEQRKVYGASFDLTDELDQQLQAVHALRRAVLDENNVIKEGMTTRDVNELNKTASALMNLLMKHHKDVINMGRMRAVEEAILSVVMTWPEPEERGRFIDAIEKALNELE